MKKLVVVAMSSLCLLLLTPALASASTLTLKSLAKTVAALKTKVSNQQAQIKTLNTELADAQSVLALAP